MKNETHSSKLPMAKRAPSASLKKESLRPMRSMVKGQSSRPINLARNTLTTAVPFKLKGPPTEAN